MLLAVVVEDAVRLICDGSVVIIIIIITAYLRRIGGNCLEALVVCIGGSMGAGRRTRGSVNGSMDQSMGG